MKTSFAISYLKGDATQPVAAGFKVIAHICNDEGKWGRGFVLAVSKHWAEPERHFRIWFAQTPRPKLGDVQFVNVESEITVANIVGQHKVRSATGTPPIRYAAVEEGLMRVAAYAIEHSATVHMPRIGCGLAGGTWEHMEPIISRTLIGSGVAVIIYDL